MKKIAGVVILYNPESHTWDNIQSYLPFLDYLIIVDNSSANNLALFPENFENNNVEYLLYNENIGIAKALNIAANKALEKGHEWLLTMDQDSYFDSAVFQQYLSCIQRFSSISKVGMFGAQYNVKIREDFCRYEEMEHLITSGSILNLSIFQKIGIFDENLFIDGVDQEYCFRIIHNGLKVIRLNNISFNHQLGSSESYRSFKTGKKTKRSLHSPLRMYYMIRNHLYLRKIYLPKFSKDLAETKNDILIRLKNNFLYRNDRWELFKLVLKAFRDNRRKKMGKIKL